MLNIFKLKKQKEAEMAELNRRYGVVLSYEAELDDLYASWRSGNIDDNEYTQKRDQLKKNLEYAKWAMNDYKNNIG